MALQNQTALVILSFLSAGGLMLQNELRQMRALGAVAFAVLSLATWSAALSHHSFSMFDSKREVELRGTVVKFDWTNPHVYLQLEVPGEAGHEEVKTTYTLEGQSPSLMLKMGWKYGMVKVGDKITANMNPLRDGRPGGALTTLVTSDGRKLGFGSY
jgi:hypothetical protein